MMKRKGEEPFSAKMAERERGRKEEEHGGEEGRRGGGLW